MLDFLNLHNNLAFTVSLLLVCGIAVLEFVSLLLGLGLFRFLDTLIPDSLFSFDPDSATAKLNFLPKIMGWLCPGPVPAVVLLILFLSIYGVLGLSTQALSLYFSGYSIPGIIIFPLCIFLSFYPLKWIIKWIHPFLPKDESSAVSQDSFIGLRAEIIIGTARLGSPTQAKVSDAFGKTHYVLVEPDVSDQTFPTGSVVVLVERQGARFKVVSAEDKQHKD
ncbi:MAG: YqiJ family protein [Candidatus Cloacimonetes bacterium]|nr:YqiJ family protein [Candidatus Cloacimonadota bacterium]